MLEGSHYLTLGGRSKPNHLCSHRICHIFWAFAVSDQPISQRQHVTTELWLGGGVGKGWTLCVMLCGLGSQRNCWGMVRPGNFPLSSVSQPEKGLIAYVLPATCLLKGTSAAVQWSRGFSCVHASEQVQVKAEAGTHHALSFISIRSRLSEERLPENLFLQLSLNIWRASFHLRSSPRFPFKDLCLNVCVMCSNKTEITANIWTSQLIWTCFISR